MRREASGRKRIGQRQKSETNVRKHEPKLGLEVTLSSHFDVHMKSKSLFMFNTYGSRRACL